MSYAARFADLFRLDPDRPAAPQIAANIALAMLLVGGPALGLVTADRYPFLIPDQVLYALGLGGIGLGFALSFALFGARAFPKGMPISARLMFRAGFGLCLTALVIGVVGVANGYRTPLLEREAPVVGKRCASGHGPRQACYIEVRLDADDVAELSARRAVYDQVDAPVVAVDTPQAVLRAMPDVGRVRLVVGQGRLGLTWLKTLEPA